MALWIQVNNKNTFTLKTDKNNELINNTYKEAIRDRLW